MTQSTPADSKVSVDSFARHAGGQMIPVNKTLSYFSVIPLEDGELQRLIYDPASSMPARVGEILPGLRVVIVGYLEEASELGDDDSPLVVFQQPTEQKRRFSASVDSGDELFIFLAVKDEDMADSHDSYYYELARGVAVRAPEDMLSRFGKTVRDELRKEVRGEIDDRGWKLKDELLRTESNPGADSDLFREYLLQAFSDTLALYFHGLCCDIDVEAGPRQLASKWIRKRLETARELLPPPKGVALFPEELNEV